MVRPLMLVVALLLGASAHAEEWKHIVTLGEVSGAARIIPLGVGVSGRVFLRYRFFAPDHPFRRSKLGDSLLEQSYVSVFTTHDVNPAFMRAGVGVEVSPAAVWRMRVSYQGIGYAGTFNNLTEFDSNDANWGIAGVRKAVRDGRSGPDLAQRVMFENQFQIKLYRMVAFTLLNAEYYWRNRPGYVYAGEYDLLQRSQGEITFRHIGAVAVVVTEGPKTPELAVGLFHAVARSIWSETQNQQAGMVFIYAPVAGQWFVYRSGLTGLFGFSLQDKYKQAFPYAVLQFNFTFQ